MRLLGVDFGSKTIGIAVAETEHGVVSPRRSIEASGSLEGDVRCIAAIARDEQVAAVVLGVPLIEGNDTRFGLICKRLADSIRAQGLEVKLVDEFLSTEEAVQALRSAGLSKARQKECRDSASACKILERYLEDASQET